MDTYDANVALGHGADERKYDEAILMLRVRVLSSSIASSLLCSHRL